MKPALATLLLAFACREDPRETAPLQPPPEERSAVHGGLNVLEPADPERRDKASSSVPSVPELDDTPAPIEDDGLASSGVPGYKRPGCSPLGPYEDEYLNAPGYDPTACKGSERMSNVVVGIGCGLGQTAASTKPRGIRCWPLSEKKRASGTYSQALAELNACPKQRGGDGVQLPGEAPLSVGTCADGSRFLREGYPSQYRMRLYDGETLLGIHIFRGVGKGADCRGEVNCDVVREDGLCGTTPIKPRSLAPVHPPMGTERRLGVP